MATVMENLLAAKMLYSQLLILVGTVIASPTSANIDAAVKAINAGTCTYPGLLQMKIDYSLDGETYSWDRFRTGLTAAIKDINALIQAESLPWVSRSRARP